MTTTVKERPILFRGEMIKAILAGRKTQTRRVVKPQPTRPYEDARWCLVWKGDEHFFECTFPQWMVDRCPYGQPGDRLWVRETWALVRADEDGIDDWEDRGPIPGELPWPGWQAWYREGHPWAKDSREDNGFRWRPSIHMPRWASRITLEITGVRVERLQAISEEDAIAEGCGDWMANDDGTAGWHVGPPAPPHSTYSYRNRFRHLWDQINGKRPGCSWEANPWVWVVEFRRVTS